MPVHPKFTREQVIQAAYDILRKEGVEALTARHLGESMGSSARPVFTLFLNMNEVKAAAMNEVRKLYKEYIDAGFEEDPPLRGVAMAYIRFAIQEPHLFKILFMTSHPKGKGKPLADVLSRGENYERIVESLAAVYDLEPEDAIELYENAWLYTHGIAAFAATSVGDAMDLQKTRDMLTQVFEALLAAE